jgi:hypothetical protein
MRERVKGAGERNTERRRKGDRMDERGMEEKAKDRQGEEWEIGIKKIFFLISWNCYFMFMSTWLLSFLKL